MPLRPTPTTPKPGTTSEACLGLQADQEPQPVKSRKLRQEQIEAFRRATQAAPDIADAWFNLGVCLGKQADQEPQPAKARKLRREAIQAYRSAVKAEPNLAPAWSNLCASLIKQARDTGKREFIDEAIEAARKAASLGDSRYNLACALAVAGSIDEALSDLKGCLERDEIKASHVKSDPDWKDLREDNRFQEILSRHERAALQQPEANQGAVTFSNCPGRISSTAATSSDASG